MVSVSLLFGEILESPVIITIIIATAVYSSMHAYYGIIYHEPLVGHQSKSDVMTTISR